MQNRIFPERYTRENIVIRKLILIIILSLTVVTEAYGQTKMQFRLSGTVKRSSKVQLSHNANKGLSYYHNSHKGTQIRIDNNIYEYHSPGEFLIPLKSGTSVVTIQTI